MNNKTNESYIVNEFTKKAIKLSKEEAEYLAKNSIQIIAERLAISQLNKESKKISNLKIQFRKSKIQKQILKDLKDTQKIKKLENTNIYSVDVHAQDYEWTKEDMKSLYFSLHKNWKEMSESKLVFNKPKKLEFLSKFINKIMVLYPQWETERLMNLDSYVNNPINNFNNQKNKYNFVNITKTKINQLLSSKDAEDYKTFPIPAKYWARKRLSEVKHFKAEYIQHNDTVGGYSQKEWKNGKIIKSYSTYNKKSKSKHSQSELLEKTNKSDIIH